MHWLIEEEVEEEEEEEEEKRRRYYIISPFMGLIFNPYLNSGEYLHTPRIQGTSSCSADTV